jgi:hypothetical protein
VTELLPSKRKALSSNPVQTKTKKKSTKLLIFQLVNKTNILTSCALVVDQLI